MIVFLELVLIVFQGLIFLAYNELISLSWESNFIYSCSLKYYAFTGLTSSTSKNPIKYFSK